MLYPAELLNSLQFHGILNHKLELKVEIHVMLLCNIKQSDGLCNCTRMVILTWKKIHQSTDNNRNTCGRNGIYIPRIVMSPTGSAWPFFLQVEVRIWKNIQAGGGGQRAGLHRPGIETMCLPRT